MSSPKQKNSFKDEPFDAAHVKRASVSGAAINFSSQIIKFVLLFLYQILVARLLSPEDFGLIAMTAPIFAFATLFTDFGFTQATVQRQDVTDEELSFIFWCNVILSLAVTVIVVALADPISYFYKEPRVTEIVLFLAATFLLAGLSTQQMALLNRRLAFAQLAAIDIVSFLAGSIAGLAFAWWQWSYWALIANQLTVSIVTLILSWYFCGWRPGKFQHWEKNKALIAFGANVTSFNVVNFFARNLDNILIGKYIGEQQLGIYDRAYKLLLLPLNQITGPISKVALPVLSRTLEFTDKYRRGYMRMLEVMLIGTYPGVIFAMMNSHQIIQLVLGPRWLEIAPIFSILAFGALFAPISNSTSWLFISQNRTGEMRNWGMLSSALFALSFVCGLPWGIKGVATCYICVGTLQGPLLWWGATRAGPLTTRYLFTNLMPYFVGAAAVLLSQIGLLSMDAAVPLVNLSVELVVAYAVFIAVIACFKSSRSALTDMMTEAYGLLRIKTAKTS